MCLEVLFKSRNSGDRANVCRSMRTGRQTKTIWNQSSCVFAACRKHPCALSATSVCMGGYWLGVVSFSHPLPAAHRHTRYTTKDGGIVIELEATEKEKDLGTSYHPRTVCSLPRKPSQFLGWWNDTLKLLIKKTSTCCIKRMYDYILNTACRYGRHTSNKKAVLSQGIRAIPFDP